MLRFLCFLFLPFVGALGQEIAVLENQHVVISRLDELNTNFRECNLSIMPNGKELYFMSTRRKPFNTSSGDGDIYKSIFLDSAWMAPQYVSQINTNSGEDEPSISYDGEKIYFQSWLNYWESSGGPYYEAQIINGKLKDIKGLGGGINQFFRKHYRQNMGYATDGMAISPDGKLFIVACGSSYKGNMDLYFSVKKHGIWTFPQLLGVSTTGDERSVYIASDNKTIYFSSNGYGGFGKLDIFKTMWNGTNTEEPVNIGKPFNTLKNDMGFVISGRGEAAYFIRDLDIYYADINDSKASLKPDSSAVVFGEITLNNKPAQSLVRVLSEGLLLGETSSDEDGKYSIVISGSFSAAEVLVDGFLGNYKSQYIESESELYQEFEIDFSANHSTEEKVDTVSTSNVETDHLNSIVYFEFDQFDVPTDEVYKLKKILRSINQSSVIFIVGHTDHLGKNQYNFDLSKKRVLAVQDYIVEFSGLSKNQFITKFEGERKVLNKGTTSNQRSMNRRVTVKVMNH